MFGFLEDSPICGDIYDSSNCDELHFQVLTQDFDAYRASDAYRV